MDGYERESIVREVREKARELESMLDDFSDRLRRMRQRNRQLTEEIASFEGELERLRDAVLDVADAQEEDAV